MISFSKTSSTNLNILTPTEILASIKHPEWDSVSAIRPNEALFMYNFVKEKGFKKTLEVGFAIGMSASHIIAATNSHHIVMDPFQERYGNFGLNNIKKLGFESLLEHRPDFSHNVLPELLKTEKTFDFIFIDGDHKFDGILVDFYYADLLLDEGGYIMLHDTWMRSTRLVEKFIKSNRDNFEYISTPLKNIAVFKKTGQDQRDGMYFREFFTFKSMLKYHVITWLTTGNDNVLKRFVRKMKGK